ncbi:MAG TPA: SRPBCC domain-containing protein [Steroidobacteraceae bacterium]|nr:SRPBCC domain-containing protein [Steroidobacteraceae bacterium]
MDAGKKESVTHIHQIYIRAPAGAIWDAITSPEWNGRYGYRAVSEYELRAGGRFAAKANAGMLQYGLPEIVVDGEVIEANPPTKLVQTYRFLFSDEHRKEGFSKLTFEIVDTGQGFCRLTVTHDVTNMPMMSHATTSTFGTDGGGGWNWILSDLKSLLETGKTMN